MIGSLKEMTTIQSYTELFNMNIDTWKSKNKLDQMMFI